jgi:DNA-binding GntR family transcriptional regulator
LVPASGKPPLGKRGPKSRKRENAAAAMRKELSEERLTVATLRAMSEKELADRYGMSRDTVRKARYDTLQSLSRI